MLLDYVCNSLLLAGLEITHLKHERCHMYFLIFTEDYSL